MKRKLSEAEIGMFARLRELPDDQIDTVDIPEAPAENWRLARRPSKPETQGTTTQIVIPAKAGVP